MTTLQLSTPHARVDVTTTSAMVLDAAFTLGDRVVHPLARGVWVGSGQFPDKSGHLRELAGEFVGVPFGSSGAPDELDAEWAGLVPDDAPERSHGPSADDDWEVVSHSDSELTLALDYAAPSPVARLERTISLRADAPAIDFTLTIAARRAGRTSVGLHPIVRLPERAGDLSIELDFAEGNTYPGRVYPSRGVTRPWSTFDDLASAPAYDGGSVDLAHLPLGHPVEEVVLLAGARGALVATYADDRTRLTLDWDRSIVPHLMMWISDRVLQQPPLLGRYRGLGLEPVAAAFDLPDSVSTAPNPLTAKGFATSIPLDPSSPTVIRYSLEISSLDA